MHGPLLGFLFLTNVWKAMCVPLSATLAATHRALVITCLQILCKWVNFFCNARVNWSVHFKIVVIHVHMYMYTRAHTHTHTLLLAQWLGAHTSDLDYLEVFCLAVDWLCDHRHEMQPLSALAFDICKNRDNCSNNNNIMGITIRIALLPWPVWLSALGVIPQGERPPVRFPVRTRARVAGSVPSWGAGKRQPIAVSLSHRCLSPFLSPSPLSKNK